MPTKNILPAILSGREGTRLWPLSRGGYPNELIEVQTGSYLGEDDSVRFEDRYGRTEQQQTP